MITPPSFDAIDRWRKFLGYEWKGDYQRRVVEHLCKHRFNTLKMPRQTGKTFICGNLFASYYLFMGENVCCAFPTLRVGSWVMLDAINTAMRRAEKRVGRRLRREVNNTMYKRWSNGGQLFLISSDESSEVEGLHATLLLWDEAHRGTVEKYNKIKPFLDVATVEGKDKTILLGIGGSTSGLLSRMTRNELYAPKHVSTAEIVSERPVYESIFREALLLQGDIGYRRNYEGEDIDEGERSLFSFLHPRAEGVAGFFPERRFAIDVGRHTDVTQVGVFERLPASWAGPSGEQYSVINWVDRQIIPNISFCDWYTDTRTGIELDRKARQEIDPQFVEEHKGQAHQIYDYIMQFKPVNGWISSDQIRFERNAIGEGLFDELQANWFPGLSSIYITNQISDAHGIGFRDRLAGRARVEARSGLLGIAMPEVRENLLGLRYTMSERDGDLRMEIDHSDDLSVLLIGISGF